MIDFTGKIHPTWQYQELVFISFTLTVFWHVCTEHIAYKELCQSCGSIHSPVLALVGCRKVTIFCYVLLYLWWNLRNYCVFKDVTWEVFVLITLCFNFICYNILPGTTYNASGKKNLYIIVNICHRKIFPCLIGSIEVK